MNLGFGLGLTQVRGTPAAVVDDTPPTLDAAAVDAAGTTLSLTFSESVTGVQAADFALSGGQALSDPTGAGANWALTTAPVYADEVLTLDYTGTAVEDLAGNLLASLSGFPVTNGSTVPEPPAPRLDFSDADNSQYFPFFFR